MAKRVPSTGEEEGWPAKGAKGKRTCENRLNNSRA